MSARSVVAAGFAVVLAVMVAVDLTARRGGRGPAPLSTALTAAMRRPAGRLVVLGVWLWLGWHFLAR